ncbi:hypothetical protein BDZ97DRAFT_1753816 [Flammula alnicola]|nr:hypothetical protein BDZ97DRAFT_1753816 [Flammula alnicola]
MPHVFERFIKAKQWVVRIMWEHTCRQFTIETIGPMVLHNYITMRAMHCYIMKGRNISIVIQEQRQVKRKTRCGHMLESNPTRARHHTGEDVVAVTDADTTEEAAGERRLMKLQINWKKKLQKNRKRLQKRRRWKKTQWDVEREERKGGEGRIQRRLDRSETWWREVTCAQDLPKICNLQPMFENEAALGKRLMRAAKVAD